MCIRDSFGTNSPNTSVKNDSIIVMKIIAKLFQTPKLIAGIILYKYGAI